LEWNVIYQKWISLKSILINNIIKPNEKTSSGTFSAVAVRSATIDKAIKTELEPNTFSLLNSSKELITDLDEFAKEGAENSVFLQKILEFFNITVTTALVLYFIIKILKPVFVLTNATFEVI
jgi:hypothetical protein